MSSVSSILARASLALALATAACEPGSPRTSHPGERAAPRAPTLDRAWMLAFLERFSSDTMAGRFTLDPESIGRAAQMIEDEYVALGVRPVGEHYRTRFSFEHGSERQRAHHVWVEAGGPAQAISAEQITTLSTAGDTAVVAELAFVGHGTRPRSKLQPSKGKIAIAIDHAPDTAAPLSAEALAELIAREREAGARAVVLVDGGVVDAELARARERVADADTLPVLSLAPAAASSLFAAAGLSFDQLRAQAHPVARSLPNLRISLAPRSKPKTEHADNLLAWIPGAKHPEQIVLVGAHYDHIGTVARGLFCRTGEAGDAVCNGADDNGSGTAMVLAIAKAIAGSARPPARTIVFVHFAGEELGLHGSKALAKSPPAVPPFAGGEIVAMLNFDMVGRLGKDGLSIGGVGSSDAWMPLLDRIGTHAVPTIYERTVSSRSDQASFYELGIPVLFFFTGLHPDYHGPGDELAAINREGMAAIGALALELVVALGDGAEVPFHAAADDDGLVTRMPGSDERTVEKRVGLPAPS
jgi:Zn-dependent M28 family amino/carboxypeptidase